MRAETAASREMELLRMKAEQRHDDSWGEEDERSRSPDSPTQLTGDEGAADDDVDDDVASSPNNHQTSSPNNNKCEYYTRSLKYR